jgi:periplasmic mercuric ion binding protein
MKFLLAGLALALPMAASAAESKTVVLDVQNMTCGLCPLAVKQALQKIPGVAEARVDFEKKTASVRFDADRADAAALVKATTQAGFPSTLRQ